MRKRTNRERGGALILALIAFIILAGIGFAFFSVSLARGQVTTKASSSDSVFHIAEAGIDDMINRMSAWGMGYSGTDSTYTVIKTEYPSTGSGKSRITGTVNGGSYTVELYPQYTTKGNYRIVSTATKNTEKRAIETWVGPQDQGKFPAFGLFGDLLVDTDGGFFADSYKSSLGTYDSQDTNTRTIGSTTYTYALANGGLGSNGNVATNNQSVIFGNVTPGPGGSYSGGAYVSGTTTSAAATVPMPPVTYTPPLTGFYVPMPSVNQIGMGMGAYNEVLLAGGIGSPAVPVVYRTNEISYGQAVQIRVTGEVTLYVDGQIDMHSQDAFILDGPAAKVKIIQGTGDVTFNGQSLINGAEKVPGSFQFDSATKGTIKFNGGTEVYLGVYAPDATFSHRGTADFYGALVTDTVDVGGGARFHYDEDINKSDDPLFEYKIKSWKEFVP